MFILEGYDSLLCFLIVALLIPVVALGLSFVVQPKNVSPEKRTTYESGIEPIGEARLQFNIRYYMFALAFVLFDVETLFLGNVMRKNSGLLLWNCLHSSIQLTFLLVQVCICQPTVQSTITVRLTSLTVKSLQK